MEHRLSNLHEVMALSAQETSNISKTEVLQIRIEPELKEAITELAAKHATTVSSFLRKVCETTLREYTEG